MAGYGSDAGLTAWLTDNGYTVTPPPSLAVLRERGSAYIDTVYGSRFKGRALAGYAQERAWPRVEVVVDGWPVATDEIPQAIVNASYRAAYLEFLQPGFGSGIIDPNARTTKKEKVEGVGEREYFAPPVISVTDPDRVLGAVDSIIDGMVRPFLDDAAESTGLGIWAVGGPTVGTGAADA